MTALPAFLIFIVMERDSKGLAVVIRSERVRENDRMLTLFSVPLGITKVISYGARKSIKCVRASLYAEGVFSLSRSRSALWSLKDIDVISTHDYLLEDLGKNMAAALFSDMVISGRDAGPELYSLYTGALDLLEFYDAESVVISFIAHYLRLAGLSGDYERCPVCQRIYGEDEVLGFSDAEGVAVCSECDTMSGSLILPPNARRFLARTLSLDIRESMDLRISPEQRHRIFRYMLRSLSLSFPGRLGSLEHGIWELDR